MQQKNNSRRIRICAVCFALLIMLIAAATYYFACRGTEYRILDDAEIQQMSARSEYSTEAERTLAESALMLVGKVNYFWGGKHMFCVCEIYFCILWFEFIFPSVCY